MSLVTQVEMNPVVPACADPLPDFSPAPVPETARLESRDRDVEMTLFVATDLRWWGSDEPNVFARDTELDGVMYRRLDPAYFSWLSSRVQLVIAAYDARRIDRPAFDSVITRWAAIYRWALATWRSDALSAATRAHDPRLYAPPRSAQAI